MRRDAALGHVAFDRAQPEEAAGAEPAGEPVDQRREVGRRRLAGQRAAIGCGAERLDRGRRRGASLDAEAGLDRLDLHGEQAEQMGAVAGGAGGADGDPLCSSPSTRSQSRARRARGEARLARASAISRAHQRRASPRAIASAVAIGSSEAQQWRDGGSSGTIGSNGSPARPSAWSRRASRVCAEAALERAARHRRSGRRSSRGRAGGRRRATASSSRSAASGSGASASRFAALRAEDQRLAAEAGERMGRAGRAGDGDPGGEAEPGAESEDPRGTSAPRRRTDGRRR